MRRTLLTKSDHDDVHRRSRVWRPRSASEVPADALVTRPFSMLRGMLGTAIAVMSCVAREGFRLHGQLSDRDALAFYKICGAQLRIWTLADTKQSYREWVDLAGGLLSYRPSTTPQLKGLPVGGVDWCVWGKSATLTR